MPRAKTAPKSAPVLETLAEKCIRLRALQQKAARMKVVYQEIEMLELQIAQAEKLPEAIVAAGKVWEMKVIDNFAVKNTVFKAAGVKRWTVKFKERAK